MADRLTDAAQAGDIDTLYTLLTSDPHLLESIDRLPFSQTPLHIAALAGQTSFLLELLNLKPSFIGKLNTDGYSAVHIASIEGHVELVRELLDYDHELGLLKGREWRTPLHCAVINGKVDVVHELLSTCSLDWLKALTVRRETVLHLALKHGQMDVFSMLVEGIKAKDADELVNWKDREGNTLLHLAAYGKQFQVIDLLVGGNVFLEAVDTDMKNRTGLTALDILKQHSVTEPDNGEIRSLLLRVGALRAHHIVVSLVSPLPPRRTTSNTPLEPLIILEELFKGLPMEKWSKEIETAPSETQSVLMVVAVLIATVTFQVALSPPGGFQTTSNSWIQSALMEGYPAFLLLYSTMNSVGFMTSIVMITVLTRRSPLKPLLRMAVLSMVATYLCSIAFTYAHNPKLVTILAVLMLTVLLLQWIHLKLRSVRKVFYL